MKRLVDRSRSLRTSQPDGIELPRGVRWGRGTFFLILLPLALMGLLASVAPLAARGPVQYESATMFPVTQYLEPGPNRTGNNYYYASARPPGSDRVAIAASGQEDLLLYEGSTFTTQRMEPLIYHRDITWRADGRRAVLGGSRLPPDTGGVIMQFDRRRNRFSVLAQTPIDVLGLARRDNTILAVGGQRRPSRSGAVYRYRNGELQTLEPPTEAVFQTVRWAPEEDRALIVGEAGTLVEWRGPDRTRVHQVPGKPFLKTIAWHPSGDFALVGGERGRLYRFENGELTRISLDLDWTIHDIAWHESGEYALMVGGIGTNDQGYWGRYENYDATSHALSRPFFSVAWMNETDALLTGQRVVWRYSSEKTAGDFGLSASLTVSHPETTVGSKVTLSGFGSTYRASSDSVAQYSFRYASSTEGDWQSHPDHNVEYRREGVFHPRLLVKGPNGEVDTDTGTIRVRNPDKRSHTGSSLLRYSMIGFFIVGLGGIVLVGGLYFFSRDYENS